MRVMYPVYSPFAAKSVKDQRRRYHRVSPNLSGATGKRVGNTNFAEPISDPVEAFPVCNLRKQSKGFHMKLVRAVPQGSPIEVVRKRDRRSFRECLFIDESRLRLKDGERGRNLVAQNQIQIV